MDEAIKTLIKLFGVTLESKDSYDECDRRSHYKVFHRTLSDVNLKHNPEGDTKKLAAADVIKGTIEISYSIVSSACTNEGGCDCAGFIAKGTNNISR